MKARRHLRTAVLVLLVAASALAMSGCALSDKDPGALGPVGVDSGVSDAQKKQDYADGVNNALQVLAQSQGPAWGAAVQSGNARNLRTAALGWRQGLTQLKQLTPPADSVPAHTALVGAVTQLDAWNMRIIRAAPNKSRTQSLFRQAASSPASRAYGDAICQLIDLGYDVGDPNACSPMKGASSPTGR